MASGSAYTSVAYPTVSRAFGLRPDPGVAHRGEGRAAECDGRARRHVQQVDAQSPEANQQPDNEKRNPLLTKGKNEKRLVVLPILEKSGRA